jgi:hypothetical protein
MTETPGFFGGSCGNRTRDQRIKSPLLYRTELTTLIGKSDIITATCGYCQAKHAGLPASYKDQILHCAASFPCFRRGRLTAVV